MAPKDVEPSGSHPQGSPGLQPVAPVPSSPVGARACVHGAALLQSHILRAALGAPGLRRPPPARCGHGRALRAETKATAGSGPWNQQGAKLPVRTPLLAALAAQLPTEQRGDILWHRHLPGLVVAVQGGHAACPHPAPGAAPSRGGSAHPGCGKATHGPATPVPPPTRPGGGFHWSSLSTIFSSPFFAAPPQGGGSSGGTQQHPDPCQPRRAGRAPRSQLQLCRTGGSARHGCRVPGATWVRGGRDSAARRKQLEGGQKPVAFPQLRRALPAHAPAPAPLLVNPREMLREELCMRRPAWKIPTGPARCPSGGPRPRCEATHMQPGNI